MSKRRDQNTSERIIAKKCEDTGEAATMISAARVRGRSHTKCDDRFFWRRSGGWHVVALADGAGSCMLSSEGAKIVTEKACRILPSMLGNPGNLDGLQVSQSLSALPVRLRLAVAMRYLPALDIVDIGDFASTLLVCAHHVASGYWVIAHIGDGVIAATDGTGKVRTLTHPDNGEFANTTRFYTDADAHSTMRVLVKKDIHGVILMSDGVSHSLYRKSDGAVSSSVAGFFACQRIFGEKACSTVLRRSIERAIAMKSDDDCSIVIFQRKD
ncbi:PP2C family serine/threonine-protein phosphatase [Hydrogenimonas cancrithermarum]|uniref:PPM-type phosphatase domain-containing protein n=1 Tax=Hydrogenimonas cancrithermarum TaxID=2993563 RepID=A0ABN6WSY7_9BACT|nr:PP2C family serine/threonine-protein phosphatase [Hydrogenimonas cancrithermarum]BDY11978.1 hypothetical protein HCR_02900 [Hydrogenimonas cancrithermarum]